MNTYNNNGKLKREDQHVSICKICDKSIFSFQERIWICSGVVGLVHQSCYDRVVELNADSEETPIPSSV